MTRFFFLVAITLAAFLPARVYSEPRLPDAKNGTDPKVIHLLLDDKDAGTLAVFNKTEVFIYLVENRGKLKFQQSVKLDEAMKYEWRVSEQLYATGGGGSLAINEKGELYLDTKSGAKWIYEFAEGQGKAGVRIKYNGTNSEKRYLKANDKTEDHQFGIGPAITVKVRRLELVAEDGDWFRIVGGDR